MNQQSSDQWLDDRIQHAKSQFQASRGLDRYSWLREWVRLSRGRITPPPGLGPESVHNLKQVGLAQEADGFLTLGSLDAFQKWDQILGLLSAPMDDTFRRGVSQVQGDSFLSRLSPHRHYSSETQKAALRSLVTMPPGATMLASMPTGTGKSLLFQLGVRWWQEEFDLAHPGQGHRACAMVIVPTIALAKDHEKTLRKMPGLENSRAMVGQNRDANQAILGKFLKGEIPILLLGPEAAEGRAKEVLHKVALPLDHQERLPIHKAVLCGVFIDEAHIIETWGRQFRPEFQTLFRLVDSLRSLRPSLPTVLLSATIGPLSLENLRGSFWRQGYPWLEINAGTPRNEFDIFVQETSNSEQRRTLLGQLAPLLPKPTIIYTTEVAEAEAIYKAVLPGLKRVALFTGSTLDRERDAVIQGWSEGTLDLVVATSAFGLGIDHPHVRTVVHACIPEGPERWYQEIGRGGRDGHQAFSLTVWTEEDFRLGQSLSCSGLLTGDTAKRRFDAIYEESATRSGIHRPTLGPTTLSADLAVLPSNLRWASDLNIRWNAALLNLLQRQGILTWAGGKGNLVDMEIRDERLLPPNPENGRFWTNVQAKRDEVLEDGLEAFQSFAKSLQRPEDSCLLEGVFNAIETNQEGFSCGRCPGCRKAGIAPSKPRKPSGGDCLWEAPSLPPGSSRKGMVTTSRNSALAGQDQFTNLAKAGLHHYLVEQEHGEVALNHLLSGGARLGWLTPIEALYKGQLKALPRVPTVAWWPKTATPYQEDELIRQFQTWPKNPKGETLILLVDPEHLVGTQERPWDAHFLCSCLTFSQLTRQLNLP